MPESPDDQEVARTLDTVAPRLRALRQQRGHTLTSVAAHTRVSVSTLSRLESGHRRPTLDLLLPLAKLYQVPLDDLVGAPAAGDPRVHLKPIRREGMTFIPLSRRSDGLNAFKSILPGRTSTEPLRQRVHPGYDWFYVLAGKLRLALGDQEHILVAGEAAEFDTRIPHAFASATSEPVEFLNLVSPHGERVHIRDL